MPYRATATFASAAVVGHKVVYRQDAVVPDDVAKAVPNLVYDDTRTEPAAADGTPPDPTCPTCGFVAKTAAGLAAHERSHATSDDG